MKVQQIMTADVKTLTAEDTIAHAEQIMNLERVRHCPVVEDDMLVGLISHRDIMAASLSSASNPSDEDDLAAKRRIKVREVMRGSVETVSPDLDAAEAAERLIRLKIGCLPVVDERYHLMGIVTETDFVALAHKFLLAAPAAEAPKRPRRAATKRVTRKAPARGAKAKAKKAAPAKVRTAKKAAPAKARTAKKAAPAKARTKRAAPARARTKKSSPKRSVRKSR